MKSKFYFSIFFAALLFAPVFVQAQGCVAVRNLSTCSLQMDSAHSSSSWQVSLNYRYFKSFRHFVGSEEQHERVEQNTQVINHDNSFIFGISKQLNPRWSVSVSIPVLYFDRSSRPRAIDDRNVRAPERHYTTSKGIGDMRASLYYSLLPFSEKGNLQIGAGVKLPTGNYEYTDETIQYRSDGNHTYIERPVDQSIQPGDGGFGLVIESNFSRKLFNKGYFYAAGSYLFNPRNTNGTLTFRGNPFEQVTSVADQFYLSGGLRYVLPSVQFSLGMRVEGIPARDLIGKSDGFRRPGYIVSNEPSVTYSKGKHLVGLSVPIALYRNRTQSVADKRLQQESGQSEHGDAAFADYLLSLTYAVRL